MAEILTQHVEIGFDAESKELLAALGGKLDSIIEKLGSVEPIKVEVVGALRACGADLSAVLENDDYRSLRTT